jgi:hypothetical protein
MANSSSATMNEEERNEFLGRGGTGVVSFPTGSDAPPHSLPVSYGFDAETDEFYFRLAFGPDAEKGGVVDDGSAVSFVTYSETDGGWRSVVATGRLTEVTDAQIDSNVATAMRRVHIPLVDVFETHPRNVEFRFFHLDPVELTGRKEVPADD